MTSNAVPAPRQDFSSSFADRIQAAIADWDAQRLDECTSPAPLLAFADRWRHDATLVALRAERRADDLRMLEELDTAQWLQAESIATPASYHAYLDAQPNGLYLDDANERLFKLDEKHAWTLTEADGSDAALQRFLATWTTTAEPAAIPPGSAGRTFGKSSIVAGAACIGLTLALVAGFAVSTDREWGLGSIEVQPVARADTSAHTDIEPPASAVDQLAKIQIPPTAASPALAAPTPAVEIAGKPTSDETVAPPEPTREGMQRAQSLVESFAGLAAAKSLATAQPAPVAAAPRLDPVVQPAPMPTESGAQPVPAHSVLIEQAPIEPSPLEHAPLLAPVPMPAPVPLPVRLPPPSAMTAAGDARALPPASVAPAPGTVATVVLEPAHAAVVAPTITPVDRAPYHQDHGAPAPALVSGPVLVHAQPYAQTSKLLPVAPAAAPGGPATGIIDEAAKRRIAATVLGSSTLPASVRTRVPSSRPNRQPISPLEADMFAPPPPPPTVTKPAATARTAASARTNGPYRPSAAAAAAKAARATPRNWTGGFFDRN